MSIITLISSGFQIHHEFGVGLVLHGSNYYSIAPKQKRLPTNLENFIRHLCILTLFADFYKPVRRNKIKTQQVAAKVQDEALPLPAKGQISAAIRHYNNGPFQGGLLFPASFRHCRWLFLHCLTLESYGSEPPSFGYKRVGSPGSGNQSGEKKQRSAQQNNNGSNGKGNKGNGQGPGKKKRGFGPQNPLIKKLACLFYKLDSGKYECCAGYNLTKWDHVLQHLKRIHLIQREHCPNCREEFKGEFAEAEKNQHILQDTCQKKTTTETGLLLEEEYNDLTGLHGSHEEKWYRAWEKLFGEHRPPYSPFIESLESVLEAQYHALERELPGLLQSFLRDASVRPESVSTSATTNAILSLLRNPISTSSSLANGEPPTELTSPIPGPSPRAHNMPPSRAPEPSTNAGECFGPSTDAVNAQPVIPTTEFRPSASQERNMEELLWHQTLGELSTFDTVFYDANEAADRWINFSGDGECFKEFEDSSAS
jgi:hypothetical protein